MNNFRLRCRKYLCKVFDHKWEDRGWNGTESEGVLVCVRCGREVKIKALMEEVRSLFKAPCRDKTRLKVTLDS